MRYLVRPASVALVCLLLVGIGGCRSLRGSDLPDTLDARVLTFEDVVRWGDLNKMYAFQRLPDGAARVEPQKHLDNVRVTGYELVEPINQVEPLRWRQAARIDYVLTDRQVVRQLVDFQVWESDDEGETWYRTTPVPVFE
jgi:hypothetical protein